MAVYSTTTTRLTGLMSGMDTDAIIQNMMKIEQMKVDRQIRNRTTMEWKLEALKGVSDDLKAFRNTYMSVLSPDNLLSEGAFRNYNCTTTDTSNAVHISAKSDAKPGTITINQIDQLATNTGVKSPTGGVSAAGENEISANNNVKLSELNFATPLVFDSEGFVSFVINDVKFEFHKDVTLNDMLSIVSSNEKAGVNFTYSRLTDTFSLTAKESGPGGELTFSNISGNLFGSSGATKLDMANVDLGENAIFWVNGEKVERSSNQFEADGLVFTLRAKTTAPIDFTIELNTDAVVDKIKNFVTGYNTMIAKLEGMLAERKTKKEKNYTALTDEEKAGMTQEQIDQWEEIAKKGILANDAGISSMLSELRGALYTKVEGVDLSPAELGLKTGLWTNGGQIAMDAFEDGSLRSWIETDIDKVMAVFTNRSYSDDPEVAAKENGLLYRMMNIMDNYTKGSQAITIESLESSITKLTDKIDTMETKMAELEEKYYLKYAAMETALAKLQGQSNWINAMLNNNNNNN